MVCTYVATYIHIHMHIHTYVLMYIHTYVHIASYIHTYTTFWGRKVLWISYIATIVLTRKIFVFSYLLCGTVRNMYICKLLCRKPQGSFPQKNTILTYSRIVMFWCFKFNEDAVTVYWESPWKKPFMDLQIFGWTQMFPCYYFSNNTCAR